MQLSRVYAPRSHCRKLACTKCGIVILMLGLLFSTGCGGVSGHNSSTPSNPAVAFLYVNNASPANTVSAYRVAADGTLTPVAGSPFATGGAGSDLDAIAISHNGQWVFAANSGSNTVSAFAVSSTGALTPVPGSPFAIVGPRAVAVSAHDQYLFVANDGEIAVFAIGSNGALAPVPGSPFALSDYGAGQMILLQNDKFLFAAETAYGKPPQPTTEAFRVGANGTLTSLGWMGYSRGDSNCAGTIYTEGEYLIQVFNVGTDGSFNQSSSFLLNGWDGSQPPPNLGASGIVLSPTEKFVFLANGFNASTSTLVIASNSLQPLPGNPWFPLNTGANTGPHAITVDRSGTLVFTATLTSAGQLVAVQTVSSDGTMHLAPGSPTLSSGVQTHHAIAVLPPKCG